MTDTQLTAIKVRYVAEQLEIIRRDIAFDGRELSPPVRAMIAVRLGEIIEELMPDFYTPEP